MAKHKAQEYFYIPDINRSALKKSYNSKKLNEKIK